MLRVYLNIIGVEKGKRKEKSQSILITDIEAYTPEAMNHVERIAWAMAEEILKKHQSNGSLTLHKVTTIGDNLESVHLAPEQTILILK